MAKILVTGATGNVGRFLVEKLVEDGHTIKALTRNPEKANLPEGVEVCKGDLSKEEDLIKVLTGVEKAFLLLPNLPANLFASVSAQMGLKHIVLVSSYSVEINWKSNNNLIAKHHAAAEEIIKSNNIPYTFLRPAGFMTTVFQWQNSIKNQGSAFLPYPDAKHAVIHPKDIALSAAAVLKDNSHIGKSYFLSGPELISPREQVKIISASINKEIKIVPIEREQVVKMMSQNLPIPFVESILELLESLPKTIEVSDNVNKLTNTEGTNFNTWVSENKNFFI